MFPSRFYSWFSCVLADRFSSWLAKLANLDLADWRPRLALTAVHFWLETATDDESTQIDGTSNEEMLQVVPARFSEDGK